MRTGSRDSWRPTTVYLSDVVTWQHQRLHRAPWGSRQLGSHLRLRWQLIARWEPQHNGVTPVIMLRDKKAFIEGTHAPAQVQRHRSLSGQRTIPARDAMTQSGHILKGRTMSGPGHAHERVRDRHLRSLCFCYRLALDSSWGRAPRRCHCRCKCSDGLRVKRVEVGKHCGSLLCHLHRAA